MVHGLSIRVSSSHERFTVLVADVGNFEVLPACALLGHVHLVEWLMRDVDEPATVEQVADALALSLQWWGPTSVVELLCQTADDAVQIFGGMGLMEEMPIHRLWRDSRLERIWDGTSEIQRHIITRSILRPLGA